MGLLVHRLAQALERHPHDISIETALLVLSIFQRLWSHLVFENRIPRDIPEHVEQFLCSALHLSGSDEAKSLWICLSELVSTLDAVPSESMIDNLFREFGQPHKLG